MTNIYSIFYGDRIINYIVQECPNLKAHYISVSRDDGVVLKGPRLSTVEAERFILKKARWILEKIELVRAINVDDIVTGSRISYLGKNYYTEVIFNPTHSAVDIDFNHSRFRVEIGSTENVQVAIQRELETFYRKKAQEKIAPRVRLLASQSGLFFSDLKFRKMSKRWGSCTNNDTIILNPDIVKLPYTLIDYIIIHELCHTKVKSHSKFFWAELALHIPNWKELDSRINLLKL